MSSRKAPAQQEIDEEYLRSLMAAPEPAASSSDTEVSEQAETPASEPRVRRSDAEDYASRFLKNTPSEARQCVYIDRRLHRKITTRRRRRTAAVTPKDDALVVTRDYGAGQRTPARAASRHSRRKGNNSDKSDHTFVPASDSDKEHRAVQATVQGWIHKEPTALTAEEENTLMREAATEEVMDIGCETTAPPAGTQSFSPQQLDCILALCKGQAVPEEQRQTLAGVLRDIRHTEVQRTLMDAISGASPIIARYLDDAEKEAAQRIAAAPK